MTESEQSKKSPSGNSGQKSGEERLFIGSRHALYGGMIAVVAGLGGQWLIGSVYSGFEARQLVESMSTSALYFGSAVVTGSATILALMLTILSLMSRSESDFDRIFYQRIELIGRLATISLMGGIILLLFLTIPVKESENTPGSWFTVIYYVLMTYLALLAGLLIVVVLMLQNALGSLIRVVRPSRDQRK